MLASLLASVFLWLAFSFALVFSKRIFFFETVPEGPIEIMIIDVVLFQIDCNSNRNHSVMRVIIVIVISRRISSLMEFKVNIVRRGSVKSYI